MHLRGLPALALIVLCACARRQTVACRTFPDQERATCERTADGGLAVTAPSLAKLSFGPDGLGTIMAGDRELYFVDRQGRTAPALNFDNGPDYFVEGLARTMKAGKVGFVNAKLETVVAPVWDFAFPFERGRARVCTGCVLQRGEHAAVTGGKWGYIDHQGKVVVPVAYDAAALPAQW